MVNWFSPDNEDIKVSMERMFQECVEDPDFMSPGKRNDDGVNFSVVCYCLGYDITDAFKTTNTYERCISPNVYFEVFERVEPYLENWCRSNREEDIDFDRAYKYMI